MKKRIVTALLTLTMTIGALAGCSSGNGNSNSGSGEADQGSASSAASDTASSSASSSDESDASSADSASGDKVTLNLYWWGNQTRNDLTKQAVDLYMEQNPNIEIKVEFTDWSGYWDKLSAMTAGGNMPDIIQQDYSYINQYQKSGQLADLTPYIEDGTIDVTDVPDSIIESGKIDDKAYAISLGSNAPIMIYDKELVEEAGVTIPDQPTMQELYDIGEEIYEKTGAKTYYDGGINMMQIVARANGSHLFDELAAGEAPSVLQQFETLVKFNSSEAAIAPELLAEKNPDVVETKPIIDQTTWNDFSFSNQYISISEVAGRELGICMYPTTDDAKEQPMYLKPSQFFSVAETSEHKDEAAAFINWFTNSVECNEILLGERGIPISNTVADAIQSKVGEQSAMIFDYISKVSEIAEPIDDPDPAGKGEVEAIGKTITEDVRYGDLSAEDAATQFTEQSKTILDEAQ